jgi:hypothetical protein
MDRDVGQLGTTTAMLPVALVGTCAAGACLSSASARCGLRELLLPEGAAWPAPCGICGAALPSIMLPHAE